MFLLSAHNSVLGEMIKKVDKSLFHEGGRGSKKKQLFALSGLGGSPGKKYTVIVIYVFL